LAEVDDASILTGLPLPDATRPNELKVTVDGNPEVRAVAKLPTAVAEPTTTPSAPPAELY
jgi:hypothetical protein